MRRARLLAPLLALLVLTVSAFALEPVESPISNGGYTHYAIDSDGTLWAWGDSFHGGITADHDLEWEEAVPEVKNARNTCVGFVTGLAVDRDGVLWGFGSDHAGKLMGKDASQGAVPLMDHVVYAEVWDVSCCALKDDGTLWVWGGGTDAATGGPIREPYQAMDHVRAFSGSYVQLEDGTWVERRYNPDGVNFEILPLADNAAKLRLDYAADALLLLGEDGNLYRAARNDRGWYDEPELLLEHVVTFSGNTAVTADGTLWAWGPDRPAILKDGAPDPEDAFDAELSYEEPAIPVKITEGVRYAEAGEDCTLAIMADGSLWELPSAYHVSIQEGYPADRFPEVQTECRKLLDQAAPVQWFEGTPDASPPVLLDMPEALKTAPEAAPAAQAEVLEAERRPVPWTVIAAALLPVAAAVLYHMCKNRRFHRSGG